MDDQRQTSNGTGMELQNQPIDEAGALPQPPLSMRLAIGFGVLAIVLAVGIATALSATSVQKPEAYVAAVAQYFPNVDIIAQSALVIDIETGETLFSLNPDAQLPLASLTKVPLALAVSEVLAPDLILTISSGITSADGSAFLAVGENLFLQDVIDFMLVTSSNNGAEFLALSAETAMREAYPNSSEENLVLWRMNDLAQELNLQQTYFLNVSGLDLSTTMAGAYGSARDVATLFKYAIKTKSSVFSQTADGDLFITSEDGTQRAVGQNTNILSAEIPGLVMGKTGFTDLAGGNLAVVFDVGIGRPVVAVVLGSSMEGRFEDIKELVRAAHEAITSADANTETATDSQ